MGCEHSKFGIAATATKSEASPVGNVLAWHQITRKRHICDPNPIEHVPAFLLNQESEFACHLNIESIN
jgi:hypothetical protein